MYEVYVVWENSNRTWHCKTSETAFRLMDLFKQQGCLCAHLYPNIPFFYNEDENHRWDIL